MGVSKWGVSKLGVSKSDAPVQTLGGVIAGASAMSCPWRLPGPAPLALSTPADSWRNPGPAVLALSMRAASWRDPGPAALALSTLAASWRDPGPAVLELSSQPAASLTHCRSASPSTSEEADRKRPRCDWQGSTLTLQSAIGMAQSGVHRASWQDPSDTTVLCSDNGLIAGPMDAEGGEDSRTRATKRRPVVNLDASAIQLVAGDCAVPRGTEYSRNGASLERIRGVMGSACNCSNSCYRQLSVNRVARICGLFWSLTSLEQEHLVKPLVAKRASVTVANVFVVWHACKGGCRCCCVLVCARALANLRGVHLGPWSGRQPRAPL